MTYIIAEPCIDIKDGSCIEHEVQNPPLEVR
jgi:hypothetical protein